MAEPERAEERTGPHAGEHWDAVWNAFRDHYVKYQSENPNWQAFFTEHHMYALDEALRAYDKARGTQAASEIEWGLRYPSGLLFEPYGSREAAEDSVRPGAKLVRREVGRWIEVPRG